MHQQIRTLPAKSPADLAAFLEVLRDGGVNIQAAGGGNVEQGGEFAVGLKDDDYAHAIEVLEAAGYKPRLVDVHYCTLEDRPGELLRCIGEAVAKNRGSGRHIRDIAVGVPDHEGRIQVQVYSDRA